MKPSFKQLVQEFVGDKELSAKELWALVKILKFVRLRCRNNAAFNNQMNMAFPYATFKQVQKMGVDRYTGAPRPYVGLQITVKGETAGAEESEEE